MTTLQCIDYYRDFLKLNKVSVAEPKLFIFGSDSTFDHNFGSGSSSSYSHILPRKSVGTITVGSTLRNMSQWRFFFILASSRLTAVNTGTGTYLVPVFIKKIIPAPSIKKFRLHRLRNTRKNKQILSLLLVRPIM